MLAVTTRQCGNVPMPTATSVTASVWSDRVANGAGGFIGVAARRLFAARGGGSQQSLGLMMSATQSGTGRRAETEELREEDAPPESPHRDAGVLARADERRAVVRELERAHGAVVRVDRHEQVAARHLCVRGEGAGLVSSAWARRRREGEEEGGGRRTSHRKMRPSGVPPAMYKPSRLTAMTERRTGGIRRLWVVSCERVVERGQHEEEEEGDHLEGQREE